MHSGNFSHRSLVNGWQTWFVALTALAVVSVGMTAATAHTPDNAPIHTVNKYESRERCTEVQARRDHASGGFNARARVRALRNTALGGNCSNLINLDPGYLAISHSVYKWDAANKRWVKNASLPASGYQYNQTKTSTMWTPLHAYFLGSSTDAFWYVQANGWLYFAGWKGGSVVTGSHWYRS